MKKLVSLLMALVLVFAMSSVAMAADPVDQSSLQDAFDIGGVITLGGDITVTSNMTVPAGKEVVLNLNGYNITRVVPVNVSGNQSVIVNKGKLTINGTGTISMDYQGATTNFANPGYFVLSNEGGTLTLNSGVTVHNKTVVEKVIHYAVDNNSTLGDTTLNINGATIISDNYVAVRQFANSTTNENVVNVYDGEINGKSRALNIQSPNGNVNKATLNVEGGEVISDNNAIYMYSYNGAITVNISDGELDGDIRVWDNGSVSTINITGGSIDGSLLPYGAGYESAIVEPVVTGGVIASGSNLTDYLDPSVADQVKTDKDGNTYIGDSIADMPVPPAPKRYAVEVAKTENGDVTVKGSASYDSGVVITAAPHYGYEVGTVTVTKADGTKLDVTKRADGTYSFSMPRGEVSIKVTFVPQGEAVKMVLTIGSKAVDVNGKAVASDVAPVIKNSRTFLPVRLIAENLGAKVEWNNDAQTVTITKGDTVIVLTVGSTTVLVNGQPAELEAPVFIENSRTYLPVRFIAEKLGADVEWNGATNEVTITGRK